MRWEPDDKEWLDLLDDDGAIFGSVSTLAREGGRYPAFVALKQYPLGIPKFASIEEAKQYVLTEAVAQRMSS